MANKTVAQLKTANTAIDTNGSNAITGAIHHDMNEDIIDSFPNLTDNANQLRQIESKKNIPLTGGVSLAVVFDTIILHASYSLVVRCIDSSGNIVTPQIPPSLEIATGFTIVAPINCTMNYTATRI